MSGTAGGRRSEVRSRQPTDGDRKSDVGCRKSDNCQEPESDDRDQLQRLPAKSAQDKPRSNSFRLIAVPAIFDRSGRNQDGFNWVNYRSTLRVPAKQVQERSNWIDI